MLNANAFLTVEKVAHWLNIQEEIVGLAGGSKATATIQNLVFTAKKIGTPGNSIQVEYAAGGTAGDEVVSVVGNLIVISMEDGVSTALQMLTKLLASTAAMELVDVATTGVSSTPQVAAAASNLTGGAYGAKYSQKSVDDIEDLINAACARCESICGTPILTRVFEEEHDGSNSNVIKPHHWPVVSIDEVKIDYNRNFDAGSIIQPSNYFLRGGADRRQAITDTALRIVGNDIVLRDDNETFIIGRIFAGAILGSVRLKYKAGWGSSMNDIPQDIILAAKQAVEYFYFQRANRDLGVSGKGTKGENYSKQTEKDLPQSVYDLLSPYEDVSLGSRPVPQRNHFRV